MRNRYQRTLILLLLVSIALPNLVAAQSVAPYSLLHWGESGGNGRSRDTAAAFTVDDVIGQPFLPAPLPTLPGVHGQQAGYTLHDGFLTEPERVKNLLLLYVNGDNDLWENMADLVKKVQRGAIDANAVILMVLDGPRERDSYLFRLAKHDTGSCDLYDLYVAGPSPAEAVTDQDNACYGHYIFEHNMEPFREDLGNPNTLATFLSQGIQDYPGAEHILVALLGHGGGWSPDLLAGQPPRIGGKPGGYGEANELGGLLWDSHSEDPNRGTSLSTPELGAALAQVQKNTGRRIDLLYLDACLMGMWEVAYEIQAPVRYLLASESWSWTTFAYDQHIQTLHTAQTVPEVGTAWIRNELTSLCPDGTCRQPLPYTYSLLDMDAMPLVSTAIDRLASNLKENLDAGQKEQIDAAFRLATCFDSNQDFLIDARDTYCDLYSFAHALEQTLPDTSSAAAAGELKTALATSLVITETHQSGTLPYGYPPNTWTFRPEVRGLSIYLPLNRDAPKEQNGADYGWKLNYYDQLAFAQQSVWDDFLDSYVPLAVQGPSCSGDCALPPPHLQTGDSDSYRVFLPIVE